MPRALAADSYHHEVIGAKWSTQREPQSWLIIITLKNNNYYYYIRLAAFLQDNLGKPAPERYIILDFTGARDDGVAVASAGPYANHLHFAPDR